MIDPKGLHKLGKQLLQTLESRQQLKRNERIKYVLCVIENRATFVQQVIYAELDA